MAGRELTPAERARAKAAKDIPIDYTDMDPELAKTIRGEATRRTKQKILYSPPMPMKKGRRKSTP